MVFYFLPHGSENVFSALFWCCLKVGYIDTRTEMEVLLAMKELKSLKTVLFFLPSYS